jgi:hypothetical protein
MQALLRMSGFRRVVLAALLCVVAITPAHAISFKATLTAIKLNARPGQVLNSSFRLTLDKDQPKTRFKSHAEDWWRSEDGKQSFYAEPGTIERSCGKWVTINPVESEALPDQTLVIRLTVNVAQDAQPGGYWCALTVEEQLDPVASTDGVAMAFLASVSTAIYVYVSPIEQNAEITGVTVGSETATLRLQNGGNTPLTIEGKVEFRRPDQDEPVAVVNLDRGVLFTEPLKTGLFSATLPDPLALPSGPYKVRAIVDFGGDHYIGVERQINVVRERPALPPGTLTAGGSPP